MRKPRTSEVAWGALIAGIAAYEYVAPDGELLSDAVDRGLEGRGKYVVMGSIALTAAHLLNTFERFGVERYDPFPAVLGKVRRKVKGV